MQYQVPQFIEIEDKIFGPLTLKQFLYVAGGVAIGFILWNFLPRFMAVIVGLPIVVFFIMAAFYKFNGRPFIFMVENYFKFTFSKKLYLWKKQQKQPEKNKRVEPQKTQINLPRLSQSKLQDLTWGLDIHKNLQDPTSVRDDQ